MTEDRTPSRKATGIGFGIGAACVILAASLFFLLRRPAEPLTAGGGTVSTAVVAAASADAAQADRGASPHTFPTDRSSAGGPVLLSGTIALHPSISQSPNSPVTVFVIARTGEGKGQTVLARRIEVESFPAAFSLTGADSMMAGALPALVSLEARIDLDGDAMTREPGSPTARLTSIAIGTTKVGLTLKPEA